MARLSELGALTAEMMVHYSELDSNWVQKTASQTLKAIQKAMK